MMSHTLTVLKKKGQNRINNENFLSLPENIEVQFVKAAVKCFIKHLLLNALLVLISNSSVLLNRNMLKVKSVL